MAKQITLGVEENGISFTFENSSHYLLGDGKIVCPKNSLILVIDESEMFTLKKANGDVFISARYDAVEGISSKADLVDWFIENAVGATGGGIEPETLAGLIADAEYVSSATSIVFYNLDGDEVCSIDATDFITDGMVDNVQISGTNLVITFNVDAGKQPISIPLTDIFNPSNYYDKTATDTLLNGKVAVSDYNTYTANTNTALNGKADTSAVTAVADSLSGKQDTLVSGTNIKTINNTSLLGSGNIDIQGGGGSSISSCTQAQYDAAEQGGTLDSDTMYVISDAPAVNIANYYTKTEVDDLLLNVDIDVDTAITAGGTNAVEGGAIYTALQGKVNNGDAVIGMSTANTTNGTSIRYNKVANTHTTVATIGSINGTKIATDTDFQLVTQSDYDEAQRVTAAALNDLNDRFGGMRIEKLTQAQYDALTVKDDNTLYIITNVVNNA